MTSSLAPAVTCLGCGCTCDDVGITIEDSRITAAERACPLGVAWFGTGATPGRVRLGGHDAALEAALDQAAGILARAARPHVLLSRDLSCEAHSTGAACADLLRARIDIAAPSVEPLALAVQERGLATATLGELRNRSDVVVFWAVDPLVRYPRYPSRYLPAPVGLHVPGGRASRTVVAVDVGLAQGPADADVRVPVSDTEEIATLTRIASLLEGHVAAPPASWQPAESLADVMRRGRYVTIVADAVEAAAFPQRLHRLLALGQAVNVPTRGALSLLRDGGNLPGAEAVLARETGYPCAVEFASGAPRYRPLADAGAAAHDVVLWLGAVDERARDLVGAARDVVAIGPGVSDSALGTASVAIDTGRAGIHSPGTAVRMDDVPLPLRPVLAGPLDAADVGARLLERLIAVMGGSARNGGPPPHPPTSPPAADDTTANP